MLHLKPRLRTTALYCAVFCDSAFESVAALSITREFVRNADSHPSSQITSVRIPGGGPSNSCFAKPSRWLWCSPEFENHSSITVLLLIYRWQLFFVIYWSLVGHNWNQFNNCVTCLLVFKVQRRWCLLNSNPSKCFNKRWFWTPLWAQRVIFYPFLLRACGRASLFTQ